MPTRYEKAAAASAASSASPLLSITSGDDGPQINRPTGESVQMAKIHELRDNHATILSNFILMNRTENDKADKVDADGCAYASLDIQIVNEFNPPIPSKNQQLKPMGVFKEKLLWLELSKNTSSAREKCFYLAWKDKEATALHCDSAISKFFFTSTFTNCSFAIYAKDEFSANPIIVHSAGTLSSPERVLKEQEKISEIVSAYRAKNQISKAIADDTPSSRMSASFGKLTTETREIDGNNVYNVGKTMRLYGLKYNGTGNTDNVIPNNEQSSAFICGMVIAGEWRFFMQVIGGNAAVNTRSDKDLEKRNFSLVEIRAGVSYEELKYKD